jgi:multisubunit Na+/H+ antiporter MnhE subunit
VTAQVVLAIWQRIARIVGAVALFAAISILPGLIIGDFHISAAIAVLLFVPLFFVGLWLSAVHAGKRLIDQNRGDDSSAKPV